MRSNFEWDWAYCPCGYAISGGKIPAWKGEIGKDLLPLTRVNIDERKEDSDLITQKEIQPISDSKNLSLWIKASSTLPAEKEVVLLLIYDLNLGKTLCKTGSYNQEAWHCEENKTFLNSRYRVTHWTKIPPFPDEVLALKKIPSRPIALKARQLRVLRSKRRHHP